MDVGDTTARLRAFSAGVSQTDVFRRVFPFDDSVYEMLSEMAEGRLVGETGPLYLAEDIEMRKPKLHLKNQLFISRQVVETLVPMPGWEAIVRAYLDARAEQTTRRKEQVDAKDLRKALSEAAIPVVEEWWEGLSPEDREGVVFYLTSGSHNEDYRGKIMDGEVVFVVSGINAMIGYLDFVGIMGLTTWVRDVEELNELIPAHSGFNRWLGRHLRNAL